MFSRTYFFFVFFFFLSHERQNWPCIYTYNTSRTRTKTRYRPSQTGIRETDRGAIISLQHTTTTSTTCPHCQQPSPPSPPSPPSHPTPTPTPTSPFDLPLPATELGCSTHRQYNYSLRHACVRAFVLVSSWGSEDEKEEEEGEEQEQEQRRKKKMLGFRLSTEREWHVAPGSSHWCEDCEAL